MVISLFEISFATARETRLHIMAQNGEVRAKRFLVLRRDAARGVTALQICRNGVDRLPNLREPPTAWQEKVRMQPYARYPICGGGLDAVLG